MIFFITAVLRFLLQLIIEYPCYNNQWFDKREDFQKTCYVVECQQMCPDWKCTTVVLQGIGEISGLETFLFTHLLIPPVLIISFHEKGAWLKLERSLRRPQWVHSFKEDAFYASTRQKVSVIGHHNQEDSFQLTLYHMFLVLSAASHCGWPWTLESDISIRHTVWFIKTMT